MILAKQHRLEPREVKRIFKAFQLVDPGEGGMDIQDFHAMMCNVFDVPSIHTETLHTAHTACGFDDSAIIERFVEWYVQNMFTEVNALKACPKQTTDTNLTYTLARKHGCSIQAVDKIRKEFVRFDADGSGEIDYQEFCNMMGVLMKVASLGDISEQRLKKFWQETSKSGKGLVDLAGFCEWYLKYFNPDDQERQSMLMCGPAEALYASYHPIVLRRNSLQGHLRSL